MGLWPLFSFSPWLEFWGGLVVWVAEKSSGVKRKHWFGSSFTCLYFFVCSTSIALHVVFVGLCFHSLPGVVDLCFAGVNGKHGIC